MNFVVVLLALFVLRPLRRSLEGGQPAVTAGVKVLR